MLAGRRNHAVDAVALHGGGDESADVRSLEGTVDVPRQRSDVCVGVLPVTKDSIGGPKNAVVLECRIISQGLPSG